MTNEPPLEASGVLEAPPAVDPARTALFLDLDGTLAPLMPTPWAVGPDPERRRLLDDVARVLQGRLAVVSGRSLDDIDRVLEGRVPAVAAVHGLVRRTALGQVHRSGDDGRVPEAAAALSAIARTGEGLMVEDKGASVALHYRGAPSFGPSCHALAARLATELGLKVQEGDHVVELRAPGPNKGDAIRAFMAEPPFAGHTPVFLGDDLTDEAGFQAVREMGGRGVIVGSRRPTGAQFAVSDIAGAHAWLRRLRPVPA
jgi:trehalose 6-phosphate phosphatase